MADSPTAHQQPAPKTKRWRTPAALVLAAAFLFLSGFTSWPDLIRGMRPANQSEEFFRYAAQQLEEPSLCQKIPWSVQLPGGFFYSPSYDRSECYDFIAGRTRNPWLCVYVRRLGPFNPISEQTSMWSCLRHSLHGFNAGMAVSQENLVAHFQQMGYDPDTLQSEGITPPLINLKDLYRQLPNRPGLIDRIKADRILADRNFAGRNLVEQNLVEQNNVAPSQPTSDTASDDAYLADMAALVANNSQWCLRIPPNLPLATERATFRNWCLFTLASNARDAQLCSRIPIPAGDRDPRLSLQATCLFQVRSPYPRNTRYAPEVPAGDQQIRRLIATLHYEIPRAKDLPLYDIYSAYDRFLDELNNRIDPQHRAARQRFIARVRQLPDSK